MLLTGFRTADGFAELLTMLLVFVLVLILAWYTTRWIARYQHGQKKAGNISIIETCPAGNGRFIQIVKVADTYFVIALSKEQVTLLGQIPGEQLSFPEEERKDALSFKEWFHKAGAAYRGSGQKTEDDGSNPPSDDNASKEE